MSLWTEVASRAETTRLVQLTNPGDPSASSVNTARADKAVADAKAAFKVYAQETFDETDADHIRLGFMGVIAYLQSYGSSAGGDAEVKTSDYHAACSRYAKAHARRRARPAGTSTRKPSTEKMTPPDFDDDRWDDLIPDSPAAQEDD